jgi:hypothetical protein
MGASWLEVDTLIRETEKLFEFPHAEACPPSHGRRDMVAETAMVVSLAGLSDDHEAESEAQILLARARVACSTRRRRSAAPRRPSRVSRRPGRGRCSSCGSARPARAGSEPAVFSALGADRGHRRVRLARRPVDGS